MVFIENFLKNVFENDLALFLYSLISIIIYTLVLIIVKRIVSATIKKVVAGKQKRNSLDVNLVHITKLIDNITNILFWLFFIVIVLDATGLNSIFGALIATAGISTLVIVLAAQTTFKDIIAGISLIIENKINIGDEVDIDGTFGTVVNIGLKSTHIKREGDEIVIIPNGNINKIANYSRDDVNLTLDISVSINNNLDNVKQIILSATGEFKNEFPDAVRGYYIVGISEQSLERIKLKLYCGIRWQNYKELEYKLREIIIITLKDNNIKF